MDINNDDMVLNLNLNNEDEFPENNQNEIPTIRSKADLDNLDLQASNNAQSSMIVILRDGFLAEATQVSNHIKCVYEFEKDKIYLYDGCLERYHFYEKLKRNKCSFLIKISDNLENSNSFYHIGKCYNIVNDKINFKNFTEYVKKYSDSIIVNYVDKLEDWKSKKDYKLFYIYSNKGSFSLFLNELKEEYKIRKLGINLKDYYPLDEETSPKLLECLNQKLRNKNLKVKYSGRVNGNNIKELEFN